MMPDVDASRPSAASGAGEMLASYELSTATRAATFIAGDRVFVRDRSKRYTGCIVEEVDEEDGGPHRGKYRVRIAEEEEGEEREEERKVLHYKARALIHDRRAAEAQVIVCFSTASFRQFGSSCVGREDSVLELGGSYGEGTRVLAQTGARCVVALELGEAAVKQARAALADFDNVRTFERCDVLASPERVRALAKAVGGFTKVFIDIGGDREAESVAVLARFVAAELRPRLIVIKSEEVHARIRAHVRRAESSAGEAGTSGGLAAAGGDPEREGGPVPAPVARAMWAELWEECVRANEAGWFWPQDLRYLNPPGGLLRHWDLRKAIRAPPVYTSDGVQICKYSNWRECVKRGCEMAHDYCCLCRAPGHAAPACHLQGPPPPAV